MRYISFTSIAKRCPNGKWRDDETGQCIPKEEWQAKYHRDSPKQKTDDDVKNEESEKKINELRAHYGMSAEHLQVINKFYSIKKHNPLIKSKNAIELCDKALSDTKIPIDRALNKITQVYFDGTSDTGLKQFKGKNRTSVLEGLKAITEVSPFVTQALNYVQVNDYLPEQCYGQSDYSNVVKISSKDFITNVNVNDLKSNLELRKVKNVSGEEDKLAWSFSPSNFEEMSDEELIAYSLKNTLTHEIGHTICNYMSALLSVRKYAGDDEKYMFNALADDDIDYILDFHEFRGIEKVISDCESIYKELYELTEETFNPFDCYSEYGYYVSGFRANDESPAESQELYTRIAEERIAEAFSDVCCRENPNTMSVLIVSAVNYNIYKAISGTDVPFRDYFFGDSMKEQREKMKDNRVIKRKKGCPEGMHTHPNRDDCHPISLRHRVGSMAWKDHVAMGLETPEGEEKPQEKKPEKKEPQKKEPEKKEPKETKTTIKPYEGGIPKPEGLKYMMGFVRDKIKEARSDFVEESTSVAKKFKETYDEIDWDNVTSENVNSTVTEFLEKMGVKLIPPTEEHFWNADYTQFDFSQEPIECTKASLQYLVTVMQEYPWVAQAFHGFGTTRSGVESYDPTTQRILFNHKFFKRGKEIFDTVGEDINPLTGEKTDWGFHYKGTTFSNCVQHEYGHLMDDLITYLVFCTYPKDIPKEEKKKEYVRWNEEDEKKLKGAISDALDVDVKSMTYSDWSRGRYSLEVSYPKNGERLYSDCKDKIKNKLKELGIKGVTSVNAYKNWNGGYTIYLNIRATTTVTKPEGKIERKKFEGDLTDMDTTIFRYAGKWHKDSELPNQIRVDRIKECEEVYKKLFNVSKIDPTEVYSRYGYYGTAQYKSGSKARTKELQAGERVAEAFNDIMSRRENANSMSQLIVAHLEYEMYQCMTGDFDKSFYDFVVKDIGKDKFKDRIIKGFGGMRYIILNNAIAKEDVDHPARCPPGFHKGNGGCRRLINGEPVGELLSESLRAEAERPKKPKKDDQVLDERVNKIVSPDSKEGKIVLAMKDGKEDDAVDSRKDYIKLVNELGYYPVVIPIPDEFESYGKQFDGTRTTYDVFVDENGTYTKKRQQLHDRIIAKYLNKMKRLKGGDKQIMMFLGGGSASGKGSMDATLMQDFGIENKDDLEAFKIDPDAIMEELPEYEHFPPELRASACHREASDIAEALFYIAMRNGVSMIYDGTFSSEKPVKFAKSVDKDKYTMLYRGVVADPDDCVFFSNKRFVDGSKPKDGKKSLSRIVPETVVRETNKGAREIRKKYVKDTDLFDDAKLFEENESRRKFYEENKDTYFK